MFGLNNAQLIGRLGADATISHLTNGGRVANVSIATDESFLDKNSGDKVDRTEWHRIVTFQDGLVEMMEKHAKKGRLVYVSGKLQTRKWRKDTGTLSNTPSQWRRRGCAACSSVWARCPSAAVTGASATR